MPSLFKQSVSSSMRGQFPRLALLAALLACASSATSFAQAAAPLFLPAVGYETGGYLASATAVGDLNGDGKLDLVVANFSTNGDSSSSGLIDVLLGNGDGTFHRPVSYSFNTYPSWVVIADVNGDHKPDLIVSGQVNLGENVEPLGVFLGNGDGTFQSEVSYASGGYDDTSALGLSYPAYVADVNGDGKPDLLVVNELGGSGGSGVIGVLLGNGDGTFQPVVGYGSGGSYATSLVVADVNGDGKPDLVVGNCGASGAGCLNKLPGAIGVLLNKGDGSFQAAKSYSTGGSQYLVHNGSITVADVNGDGKPDLIEPNEGGDTVGVLLNNGNGTFRPAVTYASGGDGPNLAFVADVNGDGKLDLIVNNIGVYSGSIGVLLGNGNGTFKAAKAYSTGVAGTGGAGGSLAVVADVNSDGIADVAVAGACPSNLVCSEPVLTSVLLGNRDGSFQANQLFFTGGYLLLGLTVADVNGDGRPDLLTTNACLNATCSIDGFETTGIVGVLLNNTGPSRLDGLTFTPPSGVYVGAQAVSITDEFPSAKIYYTTNGSKPTASSTPYAGPIAVSSTERLAAIAVLGNTTSTIGSAAYTIATKTPASAINFAAGFAGAQGPMQLNGGAGLDRSRLQLTSGQPFVPPGSAFYAAPVNVQAFTTYFSFLLTDANADGFTFAIQNSGPTAVGAAGAGLGYEGIGKSVAVKFDLHNNDGEGSDSTGLFVDGALPTVPAIDLSHTGIDLHRGDILLTQATYDGANLALTLTDTATLAMWSHSFAINIPSTVGGDTAYVGFTGATGDQTADQEILSWTYVSGTP